MTDTSHTTDQHDSQQPDAATGNREERWAHGGIRVLADMLRRANVPAALKEASPWPL